MRNYPGKYIFGPVLAATLLGCNGSQDSEFSPNHWPALTPVTQDHPELETRIDALLAGMTAEEKVGQIIQAEIKYVTPEEVREYHLGAVLNGGGTVPNNDKTSPISAWVELADAYYSASIDQRGGRSGIPIMWGSDAVHGHNNVRGATIFPHNIGLGAARDTQLIQRIGAATALEVRATGLDWTFAPTVAVVQDVRWGRTYESYAEEPEIVRAYAGAMVTGIQSEAAADDFLGPRQVIATAKHYLGDGGTERGIDRGDTVVDEATLVAVHAQGFVRALEAGVQSIMASFNSWNGEKLHGHHYLLTTVLKERMGFDGFIVGDWNGHRQIPGCTVESCPQAINAGLDMFMVPSDWKALYENTLDQVQAGQIPLARLDDAVRRILRVKLRAGIFDAGLPSTRLLAGDARQMASAVHRALAREAVRKSLVLLKNNDGVLPLSASGNILVVGDGADDVAKQSGGWTLTWQGTETTREDFPAADTIFEGIAAAARAAGGEAVLSEEGNLGAPFANGEGPDVVIAVYGEEPYAEWHGDIASIEYQAGNKRDLAMLQAAQDAALPVVSVFLSGRPLWVNPELNASDAFVAAWLPGTEGGGVADVLFRDADARVQYDFTGRLSFSWPQFVHQPVLGRQQADYDPLFAFGYGLTYTDVAANLPELAENASTYEPGALDEHWAFVSRVMAPWVMVIDVADRGEQVVTGNLTEFAGVEVASIDKVSQEDARRLRMSAAGRLSLRAAMAQDLSAQLVEGGALHMDIRLDAPLQGSLTLQMRSESESAAAVDITDVLAEDTQASQWQSVSIDLACFANAGMNFAQVQDVISIVSDEPLALSFANIKIVPHTEDSATLRCGGAAAGG